MGMNDTKRENLGVHGVLNVLLWYCQEIKKNTFEKNRNSNEHRLVLFYLEGNMQIVEKELSWLKPYANNPRDNESAVEPVANSIKEFGFKVPIVATSDGEIINGHTRFKASKLLGLKKVPVIIADDLTEEQIKAFRLADNKTGELAEWNEELLAKELAELDFNLEQFGFEKLADELDEEEGEKEDPYTSKITTPTYEPTGEEVSLQDLVDTTKRDDLVRKIQTADIPSDIEEFLKNAAQRHLRFNYRNIAEYYANAPKEVQELFEDSALVIIDYDKAIENGYVKLTKAIESMIYDDDEI